MNFIIQFCKEILLKMYFISFGDGSPPKCCGGWGGNPPEMFFFSMMDNMNGYSLMPIAKNTVLCHDHLSVVILGNEWVFFFCVCQICFMFFSLQVMPLADFFFPLFVLLSRSRRWEISLSTPSGRMKSKGAKKGIDRGWWLEVNMI